MTKPKIFSDLDWVVYAETQRSAANVLSGNLTDRLAVLNQENYEMSGSKLSYEDWLKAEVEAVHNRDKKIRQKLGLSTISYPTPVHGTNAISVNTVKDASALSVKTNAQDRPDADAIATHTKGFGVSISPADCIVTSFADEENHSVGQIHTGHAGLEKGTIQAGFDKLPELNPKMSKAYLSAHAHNFPLYGEVLDRFRSNADLREYVDSNGIVRMGDLAVSQLIAAGVPKDNIEVDQRDTMTDPKLYSFRSRKEKGINGRNGLVIGVKKH